MIFFDFLSVSLEVFMENFSIFGDNFNSRLSHLTKILEVRIKKKTGVKLGEIPLHE